MTPTRALIEAEIDRLIGLLDVLDGDPDFEQDPVEEQHDVEADVSWCSGIAPTWFVIAERARTKAKC